MVWVFTGWYYQFTALIQFVFKVLILPHFPYFLHPPVSMTLIITVMRITGTSSQDKQLPLPPMPAPQCKYA